jgi:hypothetical protein
MIRAALTKSVAVALLGGLVAAIYVYPANKLVLSVLLGIYACLLWVRPQWWLFAVPALLPVLDFAPHTGWFFLEEYDLVLLTTAALAYWRCGGNKPDASPPAFLKFLFAVVLISAAIAMFIGLLPLQKVDVNAFSSYFSHYNSLRVAKGYLWALLFLPLLCASAGKQMHNIHRFFVPGILTGFVAEGLVFIVERYLFPGLTNFSSDYRPTASFSAMHTGGAALDAYLALTFPLVSLWLIDTKSQVLHLLGLAILMLGCYVGFTTFSRDVYLAYAASVVIIAGLVSLPKLRHGRVQWRQLLIAAVIIAVLAVLLTHVFASSGYRGLAASLCVLVMAFAAGAAELRMRDPGITFMGALALIAINVAMFYLLRDAPLPGMLKAPYGAFLATAGVAVAGSVMLLQSAAAMKDRGLMLVFCAFPALCLGAGLIAFHWGGSDAIPAIAVLIGAAVAIAIALRLMPQRTLRLERDTAGFAALCAIVFATAIPVSSSYYLGSRFSTVSDDLSVRLSHWREAIDMMSPHVSTSLFGMGLGRYPDTYFWNNTHDETPGTYSYGEESNRAYLRLRAPQYAIGYGEVIRMLQHVNLTPNSAYKLAFDVRRMDGNTEFGISVCERWMLYPQNCVNAPVHLMPADGNWHHYELTWNSGALGRRVGPLPMPTQLEMSCFGANSYVDVSDLSLTDLASGTELLRNGSFAHGNDGWFFSSDRNHFPWHIKNFWVNEYFETGALGLMTITLLICYVAIQLLQRGLRGDLPAAAYLASLTGCMIVGLFDSIFDVPRLTLLFFLIVFTASLRPVATFADKPLRTSFKRPEV